MFQSENRAKYMDFPAAHYETLPYDMILQNGKSLASRPILYTLQWTALDLVVDDRRNSSGQARKSRCSGVNPGGSSKPTVERHVQTEVRATVGPAPFSDQAREGYRPHVLRL